MSSSTTNTNNSNTSSSTSSSSSSHSFSPLPSEGVSISFHGICLPVLPSKSAARYYWKRIKNKVASFSHSLASNNKTTSSDDSTVLNREMKENNEKDVENKVEAVSYPSIVSPRCDKCSTRWLLFNASGYVPAAKVTAIMGMSKKINTQIHQHQREISL